MEPIRRRPQDIASGRPLPARPVTPAGHRPVFSDFTVRPHARPHAPAPAPAQPAARPTPTAPRVPSHPVASPTSAPQHHVPVRPPTQQHARPQATVSPPKPTPVPTQPLFSTSSEQPTPYAQPQRPAQVDSVSQPSPRPTQPTHSHQTHAATHHPHTPPHDTAAKVQHHQRVGGRSGLVGFICFIALAGLLLSPLLPSKAFDNFPGNSQSSSSGDESLACIDTLGQVYTSVHSDHKLGSPITYSYTTTTTQKATCDSAMQTAITGRTGQFNPLGLLIDVSLAIAISVAVARIWRRFFGNRD